jgi:hypothetical protein
MSLRVNGSEKNKCLLSTGRAVKGPREMHSKERLSFTSFTYKQSMAAFQMITAVADLFKQCVALTKLSDSDLVQGVCVSCFNSRGSCSYHATISPALSWAMGKISFRALLFEYKSWSYWRCSSDTQANAWENTTGDPPVKKSLRQDKQLWGCSDWPSTTGTHSMTHLDETFDRSFLWSDGVTTWSIWEKSHSFENTDLH